MSLLHWAGVTAIIAVIAAICGYAGFLHGDFMYVCRFLFVLFLFGTWVLVYLGFVYRQKPT